MVLRIRSLRTLLRASKWTGVAAAIDLHINKEMRGGKEKACTAWSLMCWCEISLQLCVLACVFACVTRAGRCVYMDVCVICMEGHVQYLNAGEGLHVCTGEWGVTAHGTCWYV